MNPTPIPTAVLDTNVVLDCLVFRNPACLPLLQAIKEKRLRWLVTDAMRDELAHVLARGVVDAWSPDSHRLWESWHTLSENISLTQATGEALRLRCTDPDDQKFIDLALGQAQWLISRDRAVLKLARRAKVLGVRFVRPEQWQTE